MKELENDPENPCFGCGPKNPAGLRLRFFGNETGVVADTVFDAKYSAWPEQVHEGVAFTALECTCQWTFYNSKKRIGPTMAFTVHFLGRVQVNQPAKLTGRVVKQTPSMVYVHAELIQGGELRAFMDQDIRVVRDLTEFKRLRPNVKIDDVMKRNFVMSPSPAP